jgi:RNA polymerase II subunit A C-terminal domain phosphatase
MWVNAVSFGAVCHLELSDQITHVIAAKVGTAKVNSAKAIPHVWILKAGWY